MTVETRELVRDAVHMLITAAMMVWALMFTENGYVPEPVRREVPALHFPRRRHTVALHPFRTIVRCTAPPTHRVRPGGLQDP